MHQKCTSRSSQEILIKRDDMAGSAFGDNKTKELEHLMYEALDTGCTAALTFGGGIQLTMHGRQP